MQNIAIIGGDEHFVAIFEQSPMPFDALLML